MALLYRVAVYIIKNGVELVTKLRIISVPRTGGIWGKMEAGALPSFVSLQRGTSDLPDGLKTLFRRLCFTLKLPLNPIQTSSLTLCYSCNTSSVANRSNLVLARSVLTWIVYKLYFLYLLRVLIILGPSNALINVTIQSCHLSIESSTI